MDPLCSVGGVGLAGEGCLWQGGEGIGVTRATAILRLGSKSTDFFCDAHIFQEDVVLGMASAGTGDCQHLRP